MLQSNTCNNRPSLRIDILSIILLLDILLDVSLSKTSWNKCSVSSINSASSNKLEISVRHSASIFTTRWRQAHTLLCRKFYIIVISKGHVWSKEAWALNICICAWGAEAVGPCKDRHRRNLMKLPMTYRQDDNKRSSMVVMVYLPDSTVCSKYRYEISFKTMF